MFGDLSNLYNVHKYITQSDIVHAYIIIIICTVVKQVVISILEDKFGNFYTKVIATLNQGILMTH